MKKVMKNWRYWLMAAIAVAATVSLVGMPHDGNPDYWKLVAGSKFAAAVLAYADIRLWAWFAKRGQIDDLMEYIGEGGDE